MALTLATLLSSSLYAACLPDVAASFARLKDDVTKLSAWTNDQFAPNTYRQLLKTKIGLNTHIQGIVRIPGTSKFALTGGDLYTKEGSLFIMDIASQASAEELVKNFPKKKTKKAPLEDKFIFRSTIGSSKFWHAGGIAILENLIAVPVEDNKETRTSEILFFDVSNPAHPQQLSVKIERATPTGSVILLKQNNRLVVGASSDGVFQFYQAASENLEEGFVSVTGQTSTLSKGQGQQVIEQCDGRKFLFDFDNTSPAPPIIWGQDFVRLFSLKDNFELKLLATRKLETKKFCNFKAAGSAYVLEDGRLALYGSHFYRHQKGHTFKFCQFTE